MITDNINENQLLAENLLIVASNYITAKIPNYELITKFYVKVYSDSYDIENYSILYNLVNQTTLMLAFDNLHNVTDINGKFN